MTTDTTTSTQAATGKQPKRSGMAYRQWSIDIEPHGAKRLRGNSNKKFVLVALASFANAEGTCWPSQGTLADMTGLDVKEIGRNLTKLEKDGLITRRHRINPETGRRTSDFYQLNMPVEPRKSIH